MVLAIGLSSACRSKTPFACCSGTPSPPFDRSSMCVLRGGTLVLRGGAMGALSSFDHSDITTVCVRVVRSPPSEMLLSLRGAAPAAFLFFQADSSIAALFP